MSGPARALVVGALREELAPLERIAASKPELSSDGSKETALELRSGSIAGVEVLLAVCGMGLRQAEESMSRFLTEVPEVPVLFLGVAGALSQDLNVGDLVLGGSVRRVPPSGNDPQQVLSFEPEDRLLIHAASLGILGSVSGTLVSASNIVTAVESKRLLWQKCGEPGYAAVDMESFAVAQEAERQGRRWLVVRAISDSAEDSLPSFLERCRRKDGTIDRRRVALAAVSRPSSWARLLRMKRSVDRCASELARYAVQFFEQGGFDAIASAARTSGTVPAARASSQASTT